jgi:hypothetical protein
VGVTGHSIHISEKHLDRCADEFVPRWNNRKISDINRTREVIAFVAGKRLMYKKLV